jgi:hypothetical protein
VTAGVEAEKSGRRGMCTKVLVAITLCSGLVVCAATPNATVIEDALAVHARPSTESAVVHMLKRDEAVTIAMSWSGEGGVMWCRISTQAAAATSGYVACSGLRQLSAPTPAPTASPRSITQSTTPEMEARIEHLLKLSGVSSQIRQFTQLQALQSSIQTRGVSPNEAARVASIIRGSFTPEIFLEPIRRELRNQYSLTMVERLLEWYRTPVARSVTATEIRMSSPESANRFAAFADRLRSDPPSSLRLDLVKRLDAVVDLSELQMSMAKSVLRAVAEHLNPQLPPARRVTEKQLQAIVQAVEQQRPMIKERTLARLLFIYDSVSDQDLQEYVQFWESESGQWFRTLYLRASLEGVQRAALSMINALSRSEPKNLR